MNPIELSVLLVAPLLVAILVAITTAAPRSLPSGGCVHRRRTFGPYESRDDAAQKASAAAIHGCNHVRISCENGGWYVNCVPLLDS